jgi:uncharacterized damage-inducible protein DinB
MLFSVSAAIAAEEIMPISQMLLPEFDQEMANTRKMLERVPDGKADYKPHDKSMTLGRLAGHVAELPKWAKVTMEVEVLEGPTGEEPYVATSREKLLKDFDQNVAEARAKIAGANDEDWQKIWTFKWSGKTIMSMPRTEVMRSVVMNHMIHHRAQLGVYLRLNNVEIPGMYGPSADEMKFWTSQSSSKPQ